MRLWALLSLTSRVVSNAGPRVRGAATRACGPSGAPPVTNRPIVLGLGVDTPVGDDEVPGAAPAVKLGAHHYLTKPCEPEAIEQALTSEGGDPSVAVPESPPSLARHEREYIEYVLASTGGNISEAARKLGLHRQSLQRKLRKYPPRR